MKTKFLWHFLSSVGLILFLLSMLLTSALATTVTPISNCVTVTDTLHSNNLSDGVVTIEASGWWSSKTNTVTVTNASSSKATISFEYAATGDVNSFSEGARSGTKEVVLSSGASYTITISNISKPFSTTIATLTLKNFVYKEIIEGTATITYDAYGSVKVDGATIASGGTTGTISSDGAQLVATPVAGASFVAWVNQKTNTILSQEATYALKPYATTMSIQAIFAPVAGEPYFKIAETPYNSLEAALSAVASSSDKKIVQISSGTLSGTAYTIPSGVSLLIPYAYDDTSIDSSTSTIEAGWSSTLEHANVNLISDFTHGDSPATGGYDANVKTNILLPGNMVTYTLTIPSGTTIDVNSGGKFVVGGTIASGHEKTAGIAGGPAGAHSNVQLEGTINVNTGGILSSCGYILGGGTLNVADSGTVYQPFVLMDHRDGHYAVISNNDTKFPFNRYAMLNIQSKICMAAGANMKGYADIYTQYTEALGGLIKVMERHNVSCMHVIGKSNALINLTDGSLEITYNASRYANDTSHNGTGLYNRVGTTTLTFEGTASLGSLALVVNVAGSDYSLDSSTDYFPVPYNYIINLNKGTYTIASPLKLMPGAELTVAADATLNITSSFAVMDGFRDHGVRAGSTNTSTWSVYHYPSSAVLQASPLNSSGSASMIVNGTMTVTGTFGGIVQTGGGSGTINMNGKTSLSLEVGSPSANKIMGILDTAVCGQTKYDLKARLYNPNGTLFEMIANTTYKAIDGSSTNTLDSFKYTYYNSSSSTNSTATNTVDFNATFKGSWECQTHTSVTTDAAVSPTCTVTGLTEGKHCSVCEATIIAQKVIAALGHKEVIDAAVAPTCTETGLTQGCHCSVCDEIFTAQEVVHALGHAWSAWAADENDKKLHSVVCDNDHKHVISVKVEYRLNDYIWLNALVSVSGDVDLNKIDLKSDGNLISNYVIKKITATQITADHSIKLSYDGVTLDPLDVSMDVYKKMLTDTTLLDALLIYGEAAEDKFGNLNEKNEVIYNDTKVDLGDLNYTIPDHSGLKDDLEASSKVDGITAGREGVTIGFDNCIQFIYGLNITATENFNWDNVVQIGLLRSPAGTDPLYTSNAFMAYVLYYKGYDLENDKNPFVDDNHAGIPDAVGTEWGYSTDIEAIKTAVAAGKYLELGYDMTYAEFGQTYSYRPYVLVQVDTDAEGEPIYEAAYGEQFQYGLSTYLARALAKAEEGSADWNLYYATWHLMTVLKG